MEKIKKIRNQKNLVRFFSSASPLAFNLDKIVFILMDILYESIRKSR